MTTTRKPASPIAVLELLRSVPALVTYAQAIATALTGNPSFPSPATIVAAIAALVTLLEQVLPYVQTVANADVETAATVIQSAGIAVRKVAVRKPRVFVAEQGAISGSAKLVAAFARPRRPSPASGRARPSTSGTGQSPGPARATGARRCSSSRGLFSSIRYARLGRLRTAEHSSHLGAPCPCLPALPPG